MSGTPYLDLEVDHADKIVHRDSEDYLKLNSSSSHPAWGL